MYEGCVRCSQCGNNPNIKTGTEVKREETVYRAESNQKSRILAGILQIIFPFFATGRLYLGNYYMALFQIFIASSFVFYLPFTGIFIPLGMLLPIFDGIRILLGKVSTDARGVPLK